jgi:osmoprotectant transport system ATP-binding protein
LKNLAGAAGEPPPIIFREVTAAYGAEPVLDSFSLEVLPGEILTVIGHSGCGKTTSLKLINGLARAQSGSVTVFGQEVGALGPKQLIALRRRIGYVIQGVGLFPHLTVWKNITYVLDLLREEREQSRQKALSLLGLVGLEPELLRRFPRELSGGQRQRVGLARALAFSPRLLLMDEPFGAVDGITRAQLQRLLLGLHRDLRPTIYFITHDIGEALALGDRVLVMRRGRIEQLGPPAEIRERPASDYVRQLTDTIIYKK